MVMSLLLLTACQGSSSTTQKSPISDIEVRKGTQGLSVEFVNNGPPDKVFHETQFPVGILAKNNGASDIEGGKIVFGTEIEYVSEIDSIDLELSGKSIFSKNGDSRLFNRQPSTKKITGQSETHPTTIFATACYTYQTILGTSVCIDPDLFGVKQKQKVCTNPLEGVEYGEGQGGPVVVTKVETKLLPTEEFPKTGDDSAIVYKLKPQFIIEIENKGEGEPVKLDAIERACSPISTEALVFKDFNTIKVTARLSDVDLNCKGNEDIGSEDATLIGTSRLRDKKGTIRCTLDDILKSGNNELNSNSDAYTSILRVQLDYGYTFTISKDITIQRILTY